MRRTKQKKILGKTCKFSYVELTDSAAEFFPESFEIRIDKRLKGDEFIHACLHEEFHAVWDRLGLENANVSAEMQEIIIEGLSKYTCETYKLISKKR